MERILLSPGSGVSVAQSGYKKVLVVSSGCFLSLPDRGLSCTGFVGTLTIDYLQLSVIHQVFLQHNVVVGNLESVLWLVVVGHLSSSVRDPSCFNCAYHPPVSNFIGNQLYGYLAVPMH